MNLSTGCLATLLLVTLSGCDPKQDLTHIRPFGEKLDRTLDVAVRASCKDGWTREILLRSMLHQQLDLPATPTADCEVNLRCESVAMLGPGNTIPFYIFSAQISSRTNPTAARKAVIGVLLEFKEAVPFVRGCKVAESASELDQNKIDIDKLQKPVFITTK